MEVLCALVSDDPEAARHVWLLSTWSVTGVTVGLNLQVLFNCHFISPLQLVAALLDCVASRSLQDCGGSWQLMKTEGSRNNRGTSVQ